MGLEIGDPQRRRLPSSPPPSTPSSPKKVRHEEKEKEKENCSYYDSDDDTCSYDEDDLVEYSRQVEESDGFDVEYFPNCQVMSMITPMDAYDLHEYAKVVQEYADLALTQYNQQHDTKLEFVKVLKANWHMLRGMEYYITFEVKDAVDGNTKVFQAMVWDGLEEKTVQICRPKMQ